MELVDQLKEILVLQDDIKFKAEYIKDEIKKAGLDVEMADLAVKRRDLSTLIAEVTAKIDKWEPMKVGKGKNEASYFGFIGVHRTATNRRKILANKLLEMYPDMAIEIATYATIPVTIADKWVKDKKIPTLKDAVETQTSYSYEVVQRELLRYTPGNELIVKDGIGQQADAIPNKVN